MKFKNAILPLVIIALLGLFNACVNLSQNSASGRSSTLQSTKPGSVRAKYKKITPYQAKKRIDSNKDVLIVDVRTVEEYNSKHIAGALLIPNESITDEKPQLLPNLNDEILVYCRSGNRSRQAANKLIAIGYTNVSDFGGIIEWPYETVSG